MNDNQQRTNDHLQTGKAYLVGAGCGRADLITVKGARLLKSADVVLYDRLIDVALLAHCSPNTQLIFCGKEPGKHHQQQIDINRLLVTHVQDGKQVVRLKGGDPFLFGRGGEEALVLKQKKLPFEIVPGVSSAIGVPTLANIPITQKGVSTAFAIVAGYETPDKPDTTTDWNALSHVPTLIILMGVRRLRQIVGVMVRRGRAENTPAIAISNGGTSAQKITQGTVATLPDMMVIDGVSSPAVIVIGEVASLWKSK